MAAFQASQERVEVESRSRRSEDMITDEKQNEFEEKPTKSPLWSESERKKPKSRFSFPIISPPKRENL